MVHSMEKKLIMPFQTRADVNSWRIPCPWSMGKALRLMYHLDRLGVEKCSQKRVDGDTKRPGRSLLQEGQLHSMKR